MRAISCLVPLAVFCVVNAGNQNAPKPTYIVGKQAVITNKPGYELRLLPRQAKIGVINNFNELYKRHKDTCLCKQQECLCCVKIPGLNYRSCIGYRQLRDKSLKISTVIEGLTILSDKFSLAPKTQVCSKLPSQLLGVHFCHIQVNRPGKHGGIEACTAFGFKVTSQGLMASLHFKCLTINRSGLSYTGDKLVGHPGLIDYKRNVNFEGAINRLKQIKASGGKI